MSGLPWFSQLKREILDFADKNPYKDYFKQLISGGKMLLDKDIREPLFDFLEERYGKVRILEEKTVGNSRADVVMVIPDKIVGIEIKSDADTYTRLESQDGVADNAPNRVDGITGNRYRLYQHSVDSNTNQNQEALKTQCEQAFQVIHSHVALLMITPCCHRNRRKAHHAVNLNHAPVYNDENHNRQDSHGDADKK